MVAKIRLKASGMKRPVKKSPSPKVVHPDREGQFLKTWVGIASKDWGMTTPIQPEAQFKFSTERDWRFDFAWPAVKVAVEIDGGLFQRKASGHRSITGVMRDMEKSNAAQLAGWLVLRFHSRDLDIQPGYVVDQVKKAIRVRVRED